MRQLKKLIVPVLSLSLVLPTMASAAPAPVKPAAPTVNTPAADLRAGLDYLLSEHFVLAVNAMTKAYDGAKDADLAFKALDQNALDMTPAIASIYGKAGAAEFERIFREHNNYTDDLVMATKMKDQAKLDEVADEVEEFVVEFADFLDTATEGKLPQEAAEDALRLHEQQVQETFEQYIAGDYKGAYETYREGFSLMFVISKALSSAIVEQMPEKFGHSKADTKAADLRSTLNSLAAEHVALTVPQMQKQFEGAKDYQALIDAEKAHTADFKEAIKSIYGQAGADQFEKIWVENHIMAQSDIAIAAMKGDMAARAEVNKRVESFVKEFGSFLGAATEQNLPAAAAQDAIRTHENQVAAAFDHYAAGDYEKSYMSFREAYKFVFGIGQALGGAIVTQFSEEFQEEASPHDMTKIWLKIGSKDLSVDGKVTKMDTAPFIWSGTAFVPLRYLSEGIGAEVKWDEKTRTIWVMAGEDTLTFWLGKDYMEVNGEKRDIGTKLFARDGRTAIPLRFIAELLGWDVKWNDAEWSITLTKSMME